VSNQPNIILEQDFYPAHASLFAGLMATVSWDASMKARKTASFGKPYDYSQMSYEAMEFLPSLVDVVDRLKARLNVSFNNCLLNLYATGKHTMGFHADETGNLLPGTGVAIVSLGSERTITFRSMDQTTLIEYGLKPGALLYMNAEVQDNWTHSIRKQEVAEPRISLTWRAIR